MATYTSIAELRAMRDSITNPSSEQVIPKASLNLIHVFSRREMAYETFYRKFLSSSAKHTWLTGEMLWSDISVTALRLSKQGSRTCVVTSSVNLLKKLLQQNNIYISESRNVAVSLQDWQGAVFSKEEYQLPPGIDEQDNGYDYVA